MKLDQQVIDEVANALLTDLRTYSDQGLLESVHGKGPTSQGYRMGFIDCIDSTVRLLNSKLKEDETNTTAND